MNCLSGVVYAMTNASVNNQVIAYVRDMNGCLKRLKAYDTNGNGSKATGVDPLSSQGSVVISPDGRLLFVVNAGSNSVSSFAISSTGELKLLDTISSGGDMPNCLAISGDVLYVANSGNTTMQSASNVTGFHIDCCGRLSRIPNATYLLSSPVAKPACVVFTPNGEKLVVSELSTNQITVFSVCCNGILMKERSAQSNGAGPFGSTFRNDGLLIVTEAGVNALSSYTISSQNHLVVKSGSIGNQQKATCWISLDRKQNVAYTSNAGTDTISIYDISQDGKLYLRKSISNTPNGTAAPIDNGVSKDGRNFYVLNGNEGSISVYAIRNNGELDLLQVFTDTGLPTIGAQGLAVL